MAENVEIARILEEMGDLLELEGGSIFRIRAYRNAARVIGELPEPVLDRLKDDAHPLTDLPGIGKDLAEKIATIAQSGEFPALKQLQKKIPVGLRELLTVPNLGPKRALLLYKKLGIHSKEALLKAAAEHKIRRLKGFGEKTEENIISGIEHLKETSQRFYLSDAQAYARALEAHLRKANKNLKVAAAGSLRRWKDTIGDLDYLICCEDSDAVMDHVARYEGAASIIARGPTKMSARLKNGMQVDIRIVPPDSFGAALVYFTGSKAHNIHLRKMAQDMGLKINEYGVFRGNKKIAGRTEEEVYRAVNLPWIPPELREDSGEIELALKGKLPHLVELKDIRGDLHSHTTSTDGRSTLEEMAAAAKRRGYDYLAVTDHSKRVTMARGLDEKRLRAQWKIVDKFNASQSHFRLLKGIELDILEDGSLDLRDSVLREADWVVASIHYNHVMIPISEHDQLEGILTLPEGSPGLVLFAHGSGSSRKSPRNQFVATALNEGGIGTLLFDLLTAKEESRDIFTSEYRFDIELLAKRLIAAIDWVKSNIPDLRLGLFGASTGAAAALVAAAERPDDIFAVVSRGGRPDLAGTHLSRVYSPTLLIVGEKDDVVIQLNKEAMSKLEGEKRLLIVPNATHLFEEPGALERVANEAKRWFEFFLYEMDKEGLALDWK